MFIAVNLKFSLTKIVIKSYMKKELTKSTQINQLVHSNTTNKQYLIKVFFSLTDKKR